MLSNNNSNISSSSGALHCRRPDYDVPFFSFSTILSSQNVLIFICLKYVSSLYNGNYCYYNLYVKNRLTRNYFTPLVSILLNEPPSWIKMTTNKHVFTLSGRIKSGRRGIRLWTFYLLCSDRPVNSGK